MLASTLGDMGGREGGRKGKRRRRRTALCRNNLPPVVEGEIRGEGGREGGKAGVGE
jgi:hypothetical protein